MTNAKQTFDLYKTLGIFADLKSVGVRHEGQTWEVWGHFQGENGRRNGRLAQFDSVSDAVEFEATVETMLITASRLARGCRR